MTDHAVFRTITTQGALLPRDLLERLASDRKEPGLSPSDYHLAEGERLADAISRSWARLTGLWGAFRGGLAKLAPGDAAVKLTRERWLLPLFQELGYGRLQAAAPYEHDGRSFEVSHRWERLPVHLLGAGVALDRRTKGVVGAATAAPHGLLQDLLNRADEFLWGMLSNGLRLRLLRDHHALARQAFVEFDLESLFDEGLFHEFSVLWLVCHQSRFEGPTHDTWWIERWFQTSRREGVRALDHLREGVEGAIAKLGRGFLKHPANKPLHDALRTGELDRAGFYRELLRLVYRLVFVLVAEDRGLLLDPDAPPDARERYTLWYSTARLRRLAALRRGTAHCDLWRGLRLVLDALQEGQSRLALPGLGSWLWRPEALRTIGPCELANDDLLAALRDLCWTREGGARRPVNWAALESDELGSVYESLMQLEPELHRETAAFTLKVVGGSERKTTGSYYTPTTLVECLLDASLDPLLDEAARAPSPEAALLALKVCDPACGSGHFLVAAGRRIAKRLAAVRTGDAEPAPEAVRHALRDVVSRCLYGVDKNPMAVELCKVSLWLEALEPGRPLNFLDAHVRCGDALLGATPALMAGGVPDAAFEALEGDDKPIVTALRKANRRNLGADRAMRQLDLGARLDDPGAALRALGREAARVEALDDTTLPAAREKEARHRALEGSPAWQAERDRADAWCAAFLAPKRPETREAVVTDALWQSMRADPAAAPRGMRAEVEALREAYGLFHWHLAFPGVFGEGGGGGFDLVLGNPPWDTLSPDAKEFFSRHDERVRFQAKAEQEATIAALCEDATVAAEWARTRRALFATAHFLKESGRFTMFAPGNLGKGDFNVYRMFVELALTLTRDGGRAAQIVPDGLYAGANCMAIREALFTRCTWTLLLGFENAKGVWFPEVHTAAKFALYAATKGGATEAIEAAFVIRSPEALRFARAGGTLKLPVAMVKEFSPEALAVMEFRSQRDIDIATKMYACWPKFGDEAAGPPYRTYMAEVHMGNDRALFDEDPRGVPVYEGRMVAQYDHRAKVYAAGRGRSAEWIEVPFGDPRKAIKPQWYVARGKLPEKVLERFSMFRPRFCDVGSPTNTRTLVATICPPDTTGGDPVPSLVFSGCDHDVMSAIWIAVANSFAMDFIARFKVSLHIKYTVLDSLPFPRLAVEHPLAKELAIRALRLVCTGLEMIPLWNAIADAHGWVERVPEDAPPPGATDDATRRALVAEIEAIVAGELFGLTANEVDHILETFPIVRERELKEFGVYKTKLMVLDALARRSGGSP